MTEREPEQSEHQAKAYPDNGHLEDIPSSHDTCGIDPAGEVAATHAEVNPQTDDKAKAKPTESGSVQSSAQSPPAE